MALETVAALVLRRLCDAFERGMQLWSTPAFAGIRVNSAAPSRSASSVLFLVVLTLATVITAKHVSVRDGSSESAAPSARIATSPKAMAKNRTSAAVARNKLSALQRERALSTTELLHRWDTLIAEASERMHVPQDWIRAVMRVESGGRTVTTRGPITSRVGAMGLMQLMPATYAEMRRQYGLGADPYNAHDNVLAGAAYLSWLKSKFGFPGMFAAYNAGPGTYQDHLSIGSMLPVETQNYTLRVAAFLGMPREVQQSSTIVANIATGQARLTRPDGAPFAFDPRNVVSVRMPMNGEYAPGVYAVVRVGRQSQGVQETVAMATAYIRMHGGRV